MELLSSFWRRKTPWMVSWCCCLCSLSLPSSLAGGRARAAPGCSWRCECWWCPCSARRSWRTGRRRGGRRKTSLVQTPGELHTPENKELLELRIFFTLKLVCFKTPSVNLSSVPVLLETRWWSFVPSGQERGGGKSISRKDHHRVSVGERRRLEKKRRQATYFFPESKFPIPDVRFFGRKENIEFTSNWIWSNFIWIASLEGI